MGGSQGLTSCQGAELALVCAGEGTESAAATTFSCAAGSLGLLSRPGMPRDVVWTTVIEDDRWPPQAVLGMSVLCPSC